MAERQAQRLYAQAPQLRELGGPPSRYQYDNHVSHVFAQLAARRYNPSAAEQAQLDELARQCTLCCALG